MAAGFEAVEPVETPILVADDLEHWLCPESERHQGMLTRRSPTWEDVQEVVDAAVAREAFGQGKAVRTSVFREEGGGFGDFGRAAEDLLGRVGCLPQELAEVIVADSRGIGDTVARLCPWCQRIDVKLEIMGENTCARWHRDTYAGRAIVSYNGSATQYTPFSNVDEWELENCGNNDCVIRDKSQIRSAEIGDVLFIKGKLFPGPVKGLVHKSPEKRYHPWGECCNRLVLKVDVPRQSEEDGRTSAL